MNGKVINIALVVILIAFVAVEEARISKLQASLERLEKSQQTEAVAEEGGHKRQLGSSGQERITFSKTEREAKSSGEDDVEEPALGEFGKTMRKMAENPAAKAMFAQAHQGTVLGLYGPLIEEFDLSEEEREYFVNLLAGEFADQQEMGMKLMGAKNDAEREALFQEMKQASEERKEAVKNFLNDEEDVATYESYHDRLAEHQQMPGIKAAFSSAGVELLPDQESQLVEAMYEARQETKMSETWEGEEGMRMFARENVVELYVQDWARNQEVLRSKLDGVLEENQMEVFMDSQEQVKEFQLIGIKMMQGLMKQEQ